MGKNVESNLRAWSSRLLSISSYRTVIFISHKKGGVASAFNMQLRTPMLHILTNLLCVNPG